ncbi:MAG: ParB/RepB/Spo0J family partition protein [Rhodospirillaceae bacterium]|nr:MAG: ParB/RepB/Spo0J family partition protein [Rhodospirillaceae bacterium]
MNIQMIPLNQLFKSSSNVRKIGAKEGIETLAASIKAHGLLQNLQATRRAKGEYEVAAGGRRLAALKLLVKRKHLAKNFKVPCHVLDSEDAVEVSLAENTARLAMHPADEFIAFHALAESGKGHEEIAARFGVTASVVKQRLKLAAVSPTLFDLYRSEEINLDQLMAFTVSDDHEAQENAWFNLPDWQREPTQIRRTLTEAHVEADDARVQFVGLPAYLAAGGEIVRDLFETDHAGYLTNAALLNRLVSEGLSKEAAKVQAEGWRWVEIAPELDWETLRSYNRMEPQETPATAKQQKELDRLTAENDRLVEEHGEDATPEVFAQIEKIEERIEAIGEERLTWTPEDKAVSGAIVTIGGAGVRIERGLVRSEDKKARLSVIEGGKAEEGETVEYGSPLSARLVEDLTAERTAALRASLLDNEAVALAALAHAMALPLFYPHEDGSCLDIRVKSRDLRKSAENITQSGAVILIEQRRAVWLKALPEDASQLYGWLTQQDKETVIRLIAFCAAITVDAVQAKQDKPSCPRLRDASTLAESVNLDMAVWWEPTRERFLGRVSKAIVLEAVAEGVSKEAAENIAGLKKDALIDRAAERLAGKGWLPHPLRQQQPVTEEAEILQAAE